MTTKAIELPIKYVITAIEGDKPVFYGIDQHSGGYPYWSSFLSGAKHFKDVVEAVDSLPSRGRGIDYMTNKVSNIRVGKVLIEVVDIDDTKITEERKQRALSKLTEDERRLLGL